MNSTHERVIREVIGRMADEAPLAPAPEAVGVPVVSSSPGLPGRWRSAVAVAAVLLLGALAWIARPEPEEPMVAAEPASTGELQSAVSAAADALISFSAVEGLTEARIDGHLAYTTWFTRQAGGNTVMVQTADVDVAQSAWWLYADEPPAEGERLSTVARLLVDGQLYSTDARPGGEEGTWSEGRPFEGVLGGGMMFFDEEWAAAIDEQLDVEDAEVTRRDSEEGEVWTVEYDTQEGAVSGSFRIHPDGYLAAGTWEQLGREWEATDTISPVNQSKTTYRPVEDPQPIEAPEVGAPLDLSVFDLPEDFPIGS